MNKPLGKRFWVIPLTAAIMIGSISAAGAMESGNPARSATRSQISPAESITSAASVQAQVYQNLRSRSRWLYDLMTITGKIDADTAVSSDAIFTAAQEAGVLSVYTQEDLAEPLDRLFVARTTVRALGYNHRGGINVEDITAEQSEMSTMAYYGYFIPDADDMVYPEAEITSDEYDALLTELRRYAALRGKRVLTFGDSIMYGTGNNKRGIGSMIAEKYGMILSDYSVPGAAMGVRSGRGHIRDQVKKAAADGCEPDIILLNGGTNDMNHTAFGKLTEGFDVKNISEKNFTGGFEKTMYSLQQNWSDVPVVYIRVHNMDLGPDDNERRYGERGVDVARKWGAEVVDLYSDTEMNTEDPQICSRYTLRKTAVSCTFDSIHPNALGYAQYYLPLISQAVVNSFSEASI